MIDKKKWTRGIFLSALALSFCGAGLFLAMLQQARQFNLVGYLLLIASVPLFIQYNALGLPRMMLDSREILNESEIESMKKLHRYRSNVGVSLATLFAIPLVLRIFNYPVDALAYNIAVACSALFSVCIAAAGFALHHAEFKLFRRAQERC